MNAAGEVVRQQRIYHPVTFDPALSFEGHGHNMNPEMRLSAGAVAGMTFMQVRFVDDAEALRMECVGEFFFDGVSGGHDMRNIVRY